MTMTNAPDWPENVPRDYTELAVGEWGKYIAKTVSRLNKVGRNAEDLQQYIWEKLLSSKLLEKYVTRMHRDEPQAPQEFLLTGMQASVFLGVRWRQWITQMWAFHSGGRKGAKWMPTPVEGTVASRKALFNVRDLMRVAGNETFKKHGPVGALPDGMVLPEDLGMPTRMKSIDANFMGYLKNAIHNHYCNFVRTKERREKERPHDHFATFTQRTSHMADPPPWEETLPDERNVNRTEIEAELSIEIERIRRDAGSHSSELLNWLDDGYTMPEAIRKLKVCPKEKRELERVLLVANG